jgi:signal transduction histidine kinase
MRVLLASALRRGAGPELERAADEAVTQLTEEIEKLRGLISELRPAALDEIGLSAALESLAQRLGTRVGVDVRTDISLGKGLDDGKARDRELENAIYRVAQEALNNAARHGRAERVEISLRERDGWLELVVDDDGVGFDPGTRSRGFGLRGMEERVALLGGTLDISSRPGAGTRLKAQLPTSRRQAPGKEAYSFGRGRR